MNWCWDPPGPCGSTTETRTFRVTFSLSHPGETGGCQQVGFQCRFRQGLALAVFALIGRSAPGLAGLAKPVLSQKSWLLQPVSSQLTL